MKKRTSNVSRRIVSLLMSMVLTLTLVTPAAFATEVVDGSGTPIVEGSANPADVNTSEDAEGGDTEDKDNEDSGDEQQPADPGDEGKNPDEGDGGSDDANKPGEDNKGKQNTEDENNSEDDIAPLNDDTDSDVWDGKPAEKFAGGAGTVDDPYKISTGAELAYLAEKVNGGESYSGEYFKLTNDIRLNEQDVPTGGNSWTPIGNGFDESFSGIFDGAGHVIRGLYISDAAFPGLFGMVDGTVQNLVVQGSVTGGDEAIGESEAAGGICSTSEGEIQNCGFYGKVSDSTDMLFIGGVAGIGNATNCWYYSLNDEDTMWLQTVCNGTATNCYHNIPDKDATVGNYISTDFPSRVAEGLNGYAFEKGWMLWKAAAEYPVINPELAYDVQVKLQSAVTNSRVSGEVGFGDNLKQSALTSYSGSIMLKRAGHYTGDIYYTTVAPDKRGDNAETYLTKIPAEGVDYTPTKPDEGTTAERIITLYYGTWDEFNNDPEVSGWYYDHSGSGYYSIENAKQLAFLAVLVNTYGVDFSGKTVQLSKDIDISEVADWTPIGDTDHPFKGTFNGGVFVGSGYNQTLTPYTISGLNGDLFGVVDGGTIQYVTIKGGEGRLVGTLESGSVENCMSTAKVTGAGGGLVGTSTSTGTGAGTVKNSYYYNAESRNTVAVSGDGTITNCYYLVDPSTWGQTGAPGARTEEEFKAGRVAYELGKTGDNSGNTYWGADNNKLPILAMNSTLCQLALKKLTGPDSVTVSDALQDGDTQYFYGKRGEDISINENGIASGNMATYYPAKPAKVGDSDSTAYYAVGKAITPDTSWYNAAENEFTLTDAADLFGFAKLVNEGNNFSGKTVELAADIDLTGYVWTPIGSGKHFAGTFNGNNHKVTGMSVFAAGIGYAGLFGYVSGGTVQNVHVVGKVTAMDVGCVGGIVGQVGANSVVQNCLSEVTVTATGKSAAVGGVVGTSVGTINLCWNKEAVTAGNANVGGIVGSGSAKNCANFGTVKGTSNAGGIAGTGSVENSYNLGDVTGDKTFTEGISNGTVINSYYVCKLNGTDKMAYVNTNETLVTLGGDDGKTYMAGEKKLVDELNDKHGTNELWFTNPEKNVYLPRHATKWDGETDTDCTFKTITVTYNPNGGVNKDGSNTPVTVSEMVYVVGEDVITPAKHIVLAADAENLGFKHENGNIKETPWNTKDDGSGTGYAAENTITIIELTKGITLYAQWDKIWEGMGTADEPYQIHNAEKLTALVTQVNNNGFDYNKKHFKLTSNITLTGEWTPIGNSITGASFNGNLNGNDKRISGLQITNGSGVAGLFGYLGTPSATSVKATIEKLTIEGSISCNGGQAGGLVGQIRPSSVFVLNNVHTKVSITGSGSDVGGIIGRVGGHAFFTNCSNGASVSGRGSVGGLVGSFVQGGVEFNSCSNSAAVTGTNAAGICAGQTDLAYTEFTGCVNNGAVNGTSEAAGISLGGTFTGCSNNQTVTSSNGNAAGIGINGKAEKCANHAAVSGGVNAAGILWCTSGVNSKIEFCYNTGAISGTYGSYGILAGASGTVKNCFTYNLEKHVAICPSDATGKYAIVINSYYLADKEDELLGAGEWASADDFASGKVAWGVDGGTGAHANYWTQGANNYPVPIGEGTSTSYYRAQATCGTGGTVTIKRGDGRTGDADNAVYGPSGTKVTVTATPKDSSFALKSLTLDLMSTGTTADLANPGSFALGAANAKVVATFASAGSGGGSGSGSGSGSGTGAGDENDEGLQDGVNMDVEYNVKGLVLSAYTEWGSNGGGKTFSQWLKDSPNVLRALIANSLDNMAAAAAAKKTDEASALAQALLTSLNEHSGVAGKDGDAVSKALQRFMTSGTEATFSTWLTTGSGMASGTVESIFTQYTDSLLALADRLYAKWESSGTSMTFPVWLDAQQVSMENLSETAEEPDTDTTDESQTTEAPEDVPDGQESEGQVSGNSIWEIIGTAVRENPIIVWSIVAVIAALVIVGAVRRYHKVKRDERDDNGAE